MKTYWLSTPGPHSKELIYRTLPICCTCLVQAFHTLNVILEHCQHLSSAKCHAKILLIVILFPMASKYCSGMYLYSPHRREIVLYYRWSNHRGFYINNGCLVGYCQLRERLGSTLREAQQMFTPLWFATLAQLYSAKVMYHLSSV